MVSGKLPAMNDPYLDFVRRHWTDIASVYNQFAEHFPIMLVDVQAGEIHAFPYDDFVATLAAKSYTLQLEDEPPVSSTP